MRVFAAALLMVFVSLARPAFAQDPPPPIPWVVVDLHGSIARFPTDDQALADSRGLNSLAELPGAGLGVQIGVHLYPLHTRVVTIGLGGELAIGPVAADAGARRRGAGRHAASPDRRADHVVLAAAVAELRQRLGLELSERRSWADDLVRWRRTIWATIHRTATG